MDGKWQCVAYDDLCEGDRHGQVPQMINQEQLDEPGCQRNDGAVLGSNQMTMLWTYLRMCGYVFWSAVR